jgi:hypothetical protein
LTTGPKNILFLVGAFNSGASLGWAGREGQFLTTCFDGGFFALSDKIILVVA